MDRRAFLTVATGITAGATIRPRMVAMGPNEQLASVAQRLESLRTAHSSGEPAPRIYNDLVRHAHNLDREIARLTNQLLRYDLYSIQAQALCLAGSIAFLDLNDHARAERHLRAGIDAAARSSDMRLLAWLYTKMAQRRLYDSTGKLALYEALECCKSAERQAQGNAAITANALRMKAEVYAQLGHTTLTLQSLKRAESLLASARPEEAPAWHASLTIDKIYGMAGACWLRLGDAQQSIEAFERVQQNSGKDLAHSVVVVADTARAYALAEEPEHAATMLRFVVPLASRTQSAVRRTRVWDARTALKPWRRERFVRELDEQLRDSGIVS